MTYRHTRNAIDEYVGARLRHRRESLNISQSRLGKSLNVTFSQIQKYEKGINRIGAGALLILAKALKVEVGYFYEGLRDMPPVSTDELTPRVNALASKLALLDSRRLDAVESLVDAITGHKTMIGALMDHQL